MLTYVVDRKQALLRARKVFSGDVGRACLNSDEGHQEENGKLLAFEQQGDFQFFFESRRLNIRR